MNKDYITKSLEPHGIKVTVTYVSAENLLQDDIFEFYKESIYAFHDYKMSINAQDPSYLFWSDDDVIKLVIDNIESPQYRFYVVKIREGHSL